MYKQQLLKLPDMKITLSLLVACLLWGCTQPTSPTSEKAPSGELTPLKVLIIDGQNNHEMWPKTTVMMQQYLEETGRFQVEVARTAFTWKGEKWIEEFPIEELPPTEALQEPKPDPNFLPNFSQYDVVLSNFGWRAATLPEKTQKALEDFVGNGGGLVVVHAADNSWPQWAAFNRMIALGGWGDRTEKDGPYVYYNQEGQLVRDTTAGSAGSHGPQHEFVVVHRDSLHPITQGLPTQWRHAQDELYDRLRGPAKQLHVLGTAFSSIEQKGTDRHEPVFMCIDYEEGRVFHTTLGHADYSMECVGLITLLQRGTEWAATGKVSLTDVPDDFPTAEKSSSRPFVRKMNGR